MKDVSLKKISKEKKTRNIEVNAMICQIINYKSDIVE